MTTRVSSASNVVAAQSIVVNYPAATIPGNTLVAVVWANKPITTPTGWTFPTGGGVNNTSGTNTVRIYYKVSTGDTGVTISSPTATRIEALILQYSGLPLAPTPVDDSGVTGTAIGQNVTSQQTPFLSTTDPGALILHVFGCQLPNGGGTAWQGLTTNLTVGTHQFLIIGEYIPGVEVAASGDIATWNTISNVRGVSIALGTPIPRKYTSNFGNLRNTVHATFPHVCSDDVATYAAVINRDWSASAWKRPHATGVWTSFNLGSIAGNPLRLPIFADDSHFKLFCVVDTQHRLHIRGNMHAWSGDPMLPMTHRYVRCDNTVSGFTNPASWVDASSSITVLTDFPGRYANFSPAEPQAFTYGMCEQFTDGTIVLAMSLDRHQAQGREWQLLKLPPGATTWVPLFGTTGNINSLWSTVDTVAQSQGSTDPDRSYIGHIHVTPNDVLYVLGYWRESIDAAEDVANVDWYVLKSADKGATWTTLSGAPATQFPLTRVYTEALPNGPIVGSSSWIQVWGATVLPNGEYHLSVAMPTTGALKHVWWDGTWHIEDSPGLRGVATYRNRLWYFKSVDSHLELVSLNPPESIRLGADVQASFAPNLDQRLAKQGVVSGMIPVGDAPHIFGVGNQARSGLGSEPPPSNVVNLTGITPSFPNAPVDVYQQITQSLAAIADGVSAASPTIIRFPLNGSYNLEGGAAGGCVKMVGRNNLVIDANGSEFFTLTAGAGTADQIKNRAHWWLENCTNMRITNMTIDGPFDGTHPPLKNTNNPIGSYDPLYESQQGIRLTGCTDVEIDHNRITHIGGDLVEFRALIGSPAVDCGRVTVHHNYLNGCGRQGFSIDSGYDITIEDNGGPAYPSGIIGDCGHAVFDLEPEGGGPIDGIIIRRNTIGESNLHCFASGQESFTFIGNITVEDNVIAAGADMDILATAVGKVRVLCDTQLDAWYINGRSDHQAITDAGENLTTGFTIGPGPAIWFQPGGPFPIAARGAAGNNGFGSWLKAKSNGPFPDIDGIDLIQLQGPGPTWGTATPVSGAGPNNYEFVLVNNQDDDGNDPTRAIENGVYMLIDAGSASTPWRLARPTYASLGNQLAQGDQNEDFWVSIHEGATYGGENWEFINPHSPEGGFGPGQWSIGVAGRDIKFTPSAKVGVQGRRGPWTVHNNDGSLAVAFGATFGVWKFNNIDGVTVTDNIARLQAARRQKFVHTFACCNVTISGNTVTMTPPLASGGVGGDGVTPVEQLSQGARPDYDFTESTVVSLNYDCTP